MEPEGSLLFSQKLAIGLYPEPAEFSSPPSIPLSLRSILMLSSRLCLGLPSGLFLSGHLYKHLSPPLPHACHMSRPPQPPWFNHPNNIRWRIQAIKLIIMQFSPWSVFLSFRSKYDFNTLFSKTPSLCSSLKMRGQVLHHTVHLAELQFCIFYLDWMIPSIP
jgi:hypothetical protein